VAGVANGIASYFSENEGDPGGAMKAAQRSLEAVEDQQVPWLWALAHCRVAELCLQVERGAEAKDHLGTALPVLERLGIWSEVVGLRWWMVLANLQLGAVDEAEHWLEQTAPSRADDPVGAHTYGLGVQAEILLARGEVEAGLRLWRRIVDLLVNAEGPIFSIEMDPDQEPWTLEAKAVTVVAHAQHGRLDLVEELTGELPRRLSGLLTGPIVRPRRRRVPRHRRPRSGWTGSAPWSSCRPRWARAARTPFPAGPRGRCRPAPPCRRTTCAARSP